jgi:hypothetical protein
MSSEGSSEAAPLGPLPARRSVVSAGRGLLVVAAAGAVGLAALAAGDPLVAAFGALATLLAWVVLAGPYAFAAGQVALATAVADPVATLPTLVLAEGLLVALLVVPAEPGEDWRLGASTVAALMGLVTVAGVALLAVGGGTAAAALVLLVTGGLIGYGIHRYDLVQLGVVDDE